MEMRRFRRVPCRRAGWRRRHRQIWRYRNRQIWRLLPFVGTGELMMFFQRLLLLLIDSKIARPGGYEGRKSVYDAG